jgi:hypothetical protein
VASRSPFLDDDASVTTDCFFLGGVGVGGAGRPAAGTVPLRIPVP